MVKWLLGVDPVNNRIFWMAINIGTVLLSEEFLRIRCRYSRLISGLSFHRFT